MASTVSAVALHARLRDDKGEFALLDLRERGAHGRGHPLLATCLPLSRLDLDIDRLVPRRDTPVVVLDDGYEDDRAVRGAIALEQIGYVDVSILDGGLNGWRAAGREVFEGVHVPSKAFGEYIEQVLQTPHISADELARLQAENTDMVVLDSRPLREFQRMSLPGGINLPGAELVHRVRDIVPRPETLVVVNCAGRTRSIIGAQSLIDAGLLNRVVALENGTMGWALSGRELEHNSGCSSGPPSEAARAWARQAAANVAQCYAVPIIDDATILRWRAEAEEHTLYVCDVRGPDEYRAGHMLGSLSAPGGQLVQATDSYLTTYNARVVLVDDDGVRTRMTAAWLVRMGRRNVYVLDGALDGELEAGRAPRTIPSLGEVRQVAPVDVPESATVIDLADSLRFANGHIAGAKWCVRARLAAALQDSGQIVLTSPHGMLAKVAAGDLAGRAVALVGGTDAWEAAGLPMATGTDGMIGEVDDRHLLPYDYPPDEMEGAMRGYLDWETGLVPRIERDGTLTFSA